MVLSDDLEDDKAEQDYDDSDIVEEDRHYSTIDMASVICSRRREQLKKRQIIHRTRNK